MSPCGKGKVRGSVREPLPYSGRMPPSGPQLFFCKTCFLSQSSLDSGGQQPLVETNPALQDLFGGFGLRRHQGAQRAPKGGSLGRHGGLAGE